MHNPAFFMPAFWAPVPTLRWARRYGQLLAACGHLRLSLLASPAICGSGGAARLPASAAHGRDLPAPTPEWAWASFPALAHQRCRLSATLAP